MGHLTEQDRDELDHWLEQDSELLADAMERIVARHRSRTSAEGREIRRRLEAVEGGLVVGTWRIKGKHDTEDWARECAERWYPSADVRLIVTYETERP